MDVIAQVFTVDDSGGGDQQGGGDAAQGNQNGQGGRVGRLRTNRPRHLRPFSWDRPSTK